VPFDNERGEAYERHLFSQEVSMTIRDLRHSGGDLCRASPGGAVVWAYSFAAEFDASTCREFTGILPKLDWQSPHAYFYMDIKDGSGRVEAWSFQTYALITLRRSGADRQCSSKTSRRKSG